MKTLTDNQQKLVESLQNEFIKLNSINTYNTDRFSLNTIYNTEAEKNKIVSEMIEYNKAIMSSEIENLKNQAELFNEEYEGVLKVHTDYYCNPKEFNSYIFDYYKKGLNLYQGELKASLHFVSIQGKNNNYSDLMHEVSFCMQFEGNNVEYALSDGSKINLFKVQRLVYGFNKSHEEIKTTYLTIEEMIQSETKLQDALKRLVFNK